MNGINSLSTALSFYLWLSRYLHGIAKLIIKYRLLKGKEDQSRFIEKYGCPTAPRPDGNIVWFHAVGVGEVLIIPSLINLILKDNPDIKFLITSTSKTSAEVIKINLPNNTVHQYLHLDCHKFIIKFLDYWNPKVSIWVEQDIWPGMLVEINRRNIPLALINGRLTMASVRKKQLAKKLFLEIYQLFNSIDVIDEQSKNAFVYLGMDTSQVTVTGSLKIHDDTLPDSLAEREVFQKKIGDRHVWVAASTHEGEENIIFKAQKLILDNYPDTLLILVPRVPARGCDVDEYCKRVGLRSQLRSKVNALQKDTQVYIADTIGELGIWYRLANSALIGASLFPLGGHNPYEALKLDCKVVHGPNYSNFNDDYKLLHSFSLATEVENAEQLYDAITNFNETLNQNDLTALFNTGRDRMKQTKSKLIQLANG